MDVPTAIGTVVPYLDAETWPRNLRAEVRLMPRRRVISHGQADALRLACSCLNLILACIVYWQAREISRVLSQCDPIANGVDPPCWNTSAPSSGITSCSTASISSIGSSSAGAVAP